MKKNILFILIFFVTTFTATAQNKVVSGLVRSADSVIQAASVVEKGVPGNGTSANNAGGFSITLRGKSNTLIVSAVGFLPQEVAVGKGTNVTVTLSLDESKGSVGEVVVVAYGRQKKITTTGSISTVSAEELRQNPSASLQNTLSGRLPGFFSQQSSGRPGSDGAAFFIRGQSSYNSGSNQPLIIVDDIEFTYAQFSRLDPNEIQSVSILKDASTTAVYGVRGANGVVVITTQRGKNGPPKISLRVETSLQQPTRMPKYLDAYNTALLYNQAQINDNALNPSATFTPRFSDQDLEFFKNGKDPYGHPNIDWKDVLFRKFSLQKRVNFDISGGTEKVKYFISAGYLNQGGIIKDYSKGQDVNSNYFQKRYNYRSNLDMKITRDLDLRLDLYGNIGEINNPNVGSPFGFNDVFYEYSSFLTLAPFAYPLYNPDGSYGYSNWQVSNGNYNNNNIVGRLTHYGYNRDFESNMNMVATVNHKLNFITRGLSAKLTASYTSNYSYTRGQTRDQFPSFIYNLSTDTYIPRDPNIYRVRRFFLQYNPRSTGRTLNLQGFLNYDRTFGIHHLYGLALVSRNSAAANSGNIVYNFVPNNFIGYTARIGYDYKQKYLLQFNGAYNGSDRFTEGNRFGFFPAVSAGWNVSEEKFFKNNIAVINRLKLRGSYGLVGNDRIGNDFSFYYLQAYTNANGTNGYQTSFGNNNNGYTGIQEGTLGNNSITWEKEKKLDLGIEISLFKNRMNATIEYFDNNRFDILTSRGTVSSIFGQGLPPQNLGKVNNKGYEFELSYAGDVTKDINYSVKGTYSYAKNKIIYRDEPTQLYPYQAVTGTSIGQRLVYKTIGFYRDQDDINKSPKTAIPARPGDLKYEDLNNDGVINGFDQAITGFPNLPNTNAGLQLGIGFKNLSVNVLFQGAANFNVRGTAEAIRAFSANLSAVHTRSWTPELGDNAQYPLLTHTAGISDPLSFPSTFWYIRGDYIRLKTAEISYAIPKAFVKRLGLQDVRIYTNGYNLLTWSKIDKRYEFDPEISSGTDRTNYPPQRMFNFGLSVTF